MKEETKKALIEALTEMRVRLEDAGVARSKVSAAITWTVNAVAYADYDEILRAVLYTVEIKP